MAASRPGYIPTLFSLLLHVAAAHQQSAIPPTRHDPPSSAASSKDVCDPNSRHLETIRFHERGHTYVNSTATVTRRVRSVSQRAMKRHGGLYPALFALMHGRGESGLTEGTWPAKPHLVDPRLARLTGLSTDDDGGGGSDGTTRQAAAATTAAAAGAASENPTHCVVLVYLRYVPTAAGERRIHRQFDRVATLLPDVSFFKVHGAYLGVRGFPAVRVLDVRRDQLSETLYPDGHLSGTTFALYDRIFELIKNATAAPRLGPAAFGDFDRRLAAQASREQGGEWHPGYAPGSSVLSQMLSRATKGHVVLLCVKLFMYCFAAHCVWVWLAERTWKTKARRGGRPR